MSANTPTQGSVAGPSLVGRAVLALVLTVAFYVLAVVFAAVMIGLPIARWASGNGFPIFIGIAMVVAGVSVLVSIVPRRQRFEAPGPRLERADQPELFGLVEEVADEVGHPMPDEVYLEPEANAAVAEVGAPLLPKRRVLILGLPLLELLTVNQLRGVLAHEFGHYVGGDTRVGRWVYRTRAAIVRTVAALDRDEDDDDWFSRLVRAPFVAYAKVFLRITAAVSRRQEYAADALAIRVAGRDAHVGALRRIAAGAPAFDAFWNSELVPALSSGLRPPVGEGFRRFMSAERVDRAVGGVLAEQLEEDSHDPYDSHPTLRQRLEAAGASPEEDPPSEGPPAATLVRDHDGLEEAIFHALGGEEAAGLRRVSWEEAERTWLEGYERLVADLGEVLADRTLDDVPDLARDLRGLGAELRRRHDEIESNDQAQGLAGDLLGASAILALVRRGYTFHAPPGEPITCVSGDRAFEPFGEVGGLAAGELEPEDYRQRLVDAGLAGERLVQRAPSPA